MPELNTSSLPDMIFAILFFFMVTVSMRNRNVDGKTYVAYSV